VAVKPRLVLTGRKFHLPLRPDGLYAGTHIEINGIVSIWTAILMVGGTGFEYAVRDERKEFLTQGAIQE
jgi:hypothetical protein